MVDRREVAMNVFKLKTLSVVAVGVTAAMIGAGAVSAAPKPANSGYYDPARSIFVATGPASSVAGGIVKDASGGYYDPARSTYVASRTETEPTTGQLSQGFNWTDATVGGAVGIGAILLLVGATLLSVRHRTLAT
jgi:hypothetical protein